MKTQAHTQTYISTHTNTRWYELGVVHEGGVAAFDMLPPPPLSLSLLPLSLSLSPPLLPLSLSPLFLSLFLSLTLSLTHYASLALARSLFPIEANTRRYELGVVHEGGCCWPSTCCRRSCGTPTSGASRAGSACFSGDTWSAHACARTRTHARAHARTHSRACTYTRAYTL
jgi:hypothetical protein